jgi:hypothetical protein
MPSTSSSSFSFPSFNPSPSRSLATSRILMSSRPAILRAFTIPSGLGGGPETPFGFRTVVQTNVLGSPVQPLELCDSASRVSLHLRAPVRRHRRAQGGSPMLRSIRPTRLRKVQDQLPGRLEEREGAEQRDAGPVNCISSFGQNNFGCPLYPSVNPEAPCFCSAVADSNRNDFPVRRDLCR